MGKEKGLGDLKTLLTNTYKELRALNDKLYLVSAMRQRGYSPTENDERIMEYLRERGWMTIADLQKATEIPQPSISRSLGKLRSYEVVKRRKNTKEVGGRYQFTMIDH